MKQNKQNNYRTAFFCVIPVMLIEKMFSFPNWTNFIASPKSPTFQPWVKKKGWPKVNIDGPKETF